MNEAASPLLAQSFFEGRKKTKARQHGAAKVLAVNASTLRSRMEKMEKLGIKK